MSREGRLVRITGTREERGEQMGKVLGDSARKIYDLKVSMYKPREGMMEFWEKIATASKVYIEEYAPLVWEEMKGFAKAKELTLDILLKLATEYEMLMANGHFDLSGAGEIDAGKCTAVATTDNKDIGIICAQSNDENPDFWFEAKHDVLIHNVGNGSDDLSAMVYSHPGYPAYMGINSAGVCVLWQYIDNGERQCDKGLPTCVILREILKFDTARKAVEWLRSIPRTVANNFILCDTNEIYNVECSPTRFTILHVEEGHLVHANHCVFDQQMMDNDKGLEHSVSSPGRQKALRERVKAATPGIDVEAIKQIYSTAPLLRTDGSTLAAMIFEPKSRRAHMRFKWDDESPLIYKMYQIPADEWYNGTEEPNSKRQKM